MNVRTALKEIDVKEKRMSARQTLASIVVSVKTDLLITHVPARLGLPVRDV